MIINNAQIAANLLSAGKPADASAGARPSTASEPAAILDLVTGQASKSAPGYGGDDAFAVKLQQSLQDREIQNRLETEQAWATLDNALNKLDAGEAANIGELTFSALKLKGLLEEKGLLSDAVAKKLDALADQATQELNLKSLTAIVDVLKEQGVPAEDADAIVSEVKEAASEQIEAELVEETGGETKA